MKTEPTANDVVEIVDPEDAHAAKMLGVVLSGFFVYTLLTVPYVIWWTWDGIRNSVFQ